MATTLTATVGARTTGSAPGRRRNYARRYWAFAAPGTVVVLAVIVFPWLFTGYMSLHEWAPGEGPLVQTGTSAECQRAEHFTCPSIGRAKSGEQICCVCRCHLLPEVV